MVIGSASVVAVGRERVRADGRTRGSPYRRGGPERDGGVDGSDGG